MAPDASPVPAAPGVPAAQSRRGATAAEPTLEREATTLAELAAETSRRRSPADIGATALAVLARDTGADGGLVVAVSGERVEVVASTGLSTAFVSLIERIGRLGGPLATAVDDPATVTNASLDDAPFSDDVRAAAAAEGITHVTFAGLWVAGRLAGLLGLAWRHEPLDRPSDREIRQAAALLAAAVEHARLDERLARSLEVEQTLATGLHTLVRLTRLTTSIRDEASFAALALAEIVRTFGAAAGAYLRVDGEAVEPLAARGFHPAFERLLDGRRADDWAFVRRLRDGEGAFIGPIDAATNRQACAAAAAAGYETCAAVPIRGENGLDAVLALLFTQASTSLPIDLRTLGAVERILEIATANQRLRRALAASEQRYRNLFARSPLGLVVAGLDGQVVEANAAAEATYGAVPGGLVGRAMRSLSGEPPESVEMRAAAVFDAGGGRYEVTGRRVDGSTFPAEISIAGLAVDAAREWLLIVRDLSERRRLEDELVQAQKMEAIGQLVAGVAHELNNPLASIVGFSQLIRDDPGVPATLREDADLLAAEADRTRHIVGNLLDFARRRPPERVPTRISALARSVVDLAAYSLQAAEIEAVLDIPTGIPDVPVDRAQLQQVLLNLATNATQAIRAARRPGRITIRARSLGGDPPIVRITVADDGPGVPPEARRRLFEPFFTTKPPGDGTGLGLPVSREIVEAHGGRLSFSPVPGGRGAAFHVDLLAEPVAVRRSAPDEEDAAEADLDRLPTRRVLVVDDEPSIRALLRRALRRAGLEPIVAAGGSAATAAVRRQAVAAVLCDYRLPGSTGVEVFESLTAIRPELGDRFVLMSGDVLDAGLHGFATGRGIGLLAKPFDIGTVARVVRDAALAGLD